MDTITYIIIYLCFLLLVGILLLIFFKKNKKVKEEELSYDKHSFDSEYSQKAKEDIESGKKKSSVGGFFESMIYLIASLLGKLWDWWFKPKKVIITILLLLAGLAIILYFYLSTKSGEIVIAVRGDVDTRISQTHIPERIGNIALKITAIDKTTQDTKPLSGVFFKTLVDSIAENESIAYITTNKDGIAKVKYKGRFDEKKMSILVNAMLKKTQYEDFYEEYNERDTTFVYGKHLGTVLLQRKKAKVRTLKPFLVSIQETAANLPPGMEAPPWYNIEITQLGADNTPVSSGQFFYKDSPNSKDSLPLQWDGTKFVAKELEFEKAHYIVAMVEDSSRITYTLTLGPDFAKFPLEPNTFTDVVTTANEGKLMAAGGSSVKPPPPEVQYSFQVMNPSSQIVMSSITVELRSTVTNEVFKYISDPKGEFVFPEIRGSSKEFWTKYGSFIISLSYQRIKSSNTVTWSQPSDISVDLKYMLEFDINGNKSIRLRQNN